MLGAYFKVAQRVRKTRISPEPCEAYLRTTLNACEVTLEGTELGGSNPRVPISSSKQDVSMAIKAGALPGMNKYRTTAGG